LRLAVISDIHSNLEALTAVFEEIENRDIDKIVCLGDIVGYGPNPKECIELVKTKCDAIIIGNHDVACFNHSELYYFNRFAKQALEWTTDQLENNQLDFLKSLPDSSIYANSRLVHSNPHFPQSWDYVLSIDDAIFNFAAFEEKVCFIGHSHQPIIYIENQGQKYSFAENSEITFQPSCRYIINVGSVGQPRDHNPASAFGIMDTAAQHYELIRVAYDIEKTQAKMHAAGLPSFLAERLMAGK